MSPGGFRCDECGGPLVHTSDPRAHGLPESVWKNQRVDYGARRGMIVRFLGIFAGAVSGLYGVRASVGLERPWSIVGALASLAGGTLVWWLIYVAAGRAVRVWVLRRGQLHHRKLMRALLAPGPRRS